MTSAIQRLVLLVALVAAAIVTVGVADTHRVANVGGAHVASAQVAPPTARNAPVPEPGDGTTRVVKNVIIERDRAQGSGAGMALLFWMFAAMCVGGALFVITRRNLITAVMGMVGTFFAVAAIYMMLYASFLSVIQMLVYAGAIMVLFVFVIMILNKPEDEPWGVVGLPGKIIAGLAMAYLLLRLGMVLSSVTPPDAKLATLAPPPVVFGDQTFDWGSTGAVGKSLFGEYLFPFEAISILLLVAVVGAIAIARPIADHDADAPDPAAGGAS